MHHFIDLLDWDGGQILKLLKDAARIKKAQLKGKAKPRLQNKVLGMIFEKPSLRTRVSFQAGMAELGGQSVFLNGTEVGLGKRESLADIARTVCEYVDAVVLRTFQHENVVEFARWSSKPVINGLSDYYHPCQALGDLLTVRECCGDLEGKTMTFVGDGNNVARSLAIACGKIGMKFILAAPPGYRFDQPFLEAYQTHVRGQLEEIEDPMKAVAEADVIYTDVWTSMGQEEEAKERVKHFEAYQVNAALLKAAPEHAKVMHCLPAHRGEEITDEVLDGPQSVVFPQAGNRMHAQKALLLWAMDVIAAVVLAEEHRSVRLFTPFRRQLLDERRVFRRRQSLAQDREHTLPIVLQKRLGVEPEARENFRTNDTIRSGSKILEFAAATDEPEHLLRSHRRHHVFADAGFFVIRLLLVQIDRFGAVAQFADPFGRAVEVFLFILPGLSAAFGRYHQTAVRLRLRERSENAA